MGIVKALDLEKKKYFLNNLMLFAKGNKHALLRKALTAFGE
jgi:hypothetical protein